MDTGAAGLSLGLHKYVSLLQSEHAATPQAVDVTADLHNYSAKLGDSINTNIANCNGVVDNSVSFLNSDLGVYALQCFSLLKH